MLRPGARLSTPALLPSRRHWRFRCALRCLDGCRRPGVHDWRRGGRPTGAALQRAGLVAHGTSPPYAGAVTAQGTAWLAGRVKDWVRVGARVPRLAALDALRAGRAVHAGRLERQPRLPARGARVVVLPVGQLARARARGLAARRRRRGRLPQALQVQADLQLRHRLHQARALVVALPPPFPLVSAGPASIDAASADLSG